MNSFELTSNKYWLILILFIIAYFSMYFSFSSEGTNDGGVHRSLYIIMISICISLFLLQPKLLDKTIKSISLVALFGIIIAIYNVFITMHSESFFINIVLGIVISSFLVTFVQSNKKISALAFKTFILINVIALLYQYINNVILGSSQYLHGDLFSFSRQYYSLNELGFNRVSGYQMEPGSYSTLITLTVLNLYFIEKRTSIWIYLGLFSCILTLSAISIFLCLIALFIINRKFINSSSGKIKIILLLIFSYSLLESSGFTSYLHERFSSNSMDYSALYKISNINAIISRDIFDLITGKGLSWIEPYCYNCGHLTGNGGGIYILSGIGIIGIFLYLSIYLVSKDKLLASLIILLLFISRFSVEYPLFWFFILNAIHSNFHIGTNEEK